MQKGRTVASEWRKSGIILWQVLIAFSFFSVWGLPLNHDGLKPPYSSSQSTQFTKSTDQYVVDVPRSTAHHVKKESRTQLVFWGAGFIYNPELIFYSADFIDSVQRVKSNLQFPHHARAPPNTSFI